MSALEKIQEDQTTVVDVASPNDQIMSIVEKMASNPEFDVEKMERLIALQERREAAQAKQAFYAAMAAAQNDMKPIAQNAQNNHTKSKYATLEAVNRAIQPIIALHGFSVSFGEGETNKNNHYRVVATIRHINGHSEQEHMDVPADGAGAKGNSNKNATQAFGSSITYARRYLTMAIFNLSITGEDDDGNDASDHKANLERLPSNRAKQIINFDAILKEIDEADQRKIESLEAEFEGRLAFLPIKWIDAFKDRMDRRLQELEAIDDEVAAQERGLGAPEL